MCVCMYVCVCVYVCDTLPHVLACTTRRPCAVGVSLMQEKAAEVESTKAAAAAGSIVINTSPNKVEKEHWVLIMPERAMVPYPNEDIPMLVAQACDAIVAHAGSRLQVHAWYTHVCLPNVQQTCARERNTRSCVLT